ncbi:tRNA (adenosine(37)-N6)-dimethylallyltransferase MiaA [bacterium]|nr:tRNA (adenosine(37)-N6)-dimethylallyltransferase MiaA [bacterium]
MFPCLFIQGPTATGKSSLAFELASRLKACIVNADSIQLYEGLQIGSAAPSEEERDQVDHFLFQVVSKGESWTASDFETHAFEVLKRELVSRPAIVVGGSGFYFKALEDGMGESKAESEEVRSALESELENEGELALYEELLQVDPESARKIHPHDHYRLLRALGYFRTYQSKMSEDQKLKNKRAWPGGLIKIGLTGTQEQLRIPMRLRIEEMIQSGWEREVRGLLDEGLKNWWPMKSVGYKEWVDVLEGHADRSQLVDKVLMATLHMAKRQKTWFKRDPNVQWFSFWERQRALDEILLRKWS